MTDIPADLKYTPSHEWLRDNGDGTVTMGITDHAQELLGDIVFVELPSVGETITAGEACAVVESVKAASDIYAPVSGEVAAVNEALADGPEMVNEDAYGEGWLYSITLDESTQTSELLSDDDYAKLLEEEEED
jgi:glycine cleavage system H protein